MPYADAAGLRVYYETGGAGPPLLWISGSSGDLRARPNVFDSPVAERFTVLAYDQRGLGRTDTPEGPYTMAQYAEDARALLDAVGWDRCRVLGVSFGGMVAQELAIRHPARVERLVLAATSSGGAGGSQYPVEELAGLEPRERVSRFIALRDTRNDAAWQQAHPHAFQQLADEIIREFANREPGRAQGSKWQLGARAGHDTFDRLGTIAAPTLCAGGRYDAIAPPENLRALGDAIPGAALELFEGGHFFLREDPRALERTIDFLLG